MKKTAMANGPAPLARLNGARRAWLRSIGALAAIAVAADWHHPARAAGLRIGETAPPLVLNTLDGRRIATSDLIGSVVILSFWATWCVPCREELPLLSKFATRHADQGLAILGFSLDEPGELAQVTKVAAGLSFPVGFLGSAWAGGYGRIWRLPANFTIDRRGRLADNAWDADDASWTEARLQQVVLPLLAASP